MTLAANKRIQTGVITKGFCGHYTVRADDGSAHECRARGRFRSNSQTPIVGDNVLFMPSSGQKEGWIQSLLPRKNELARPMVANIDVLFVVLAPAQPAADLALIDRILLHAEYSEIAPVLLINKCDLADDEQIESIARQYRGAGYPVHALSARARIGLESLAPYLERGICCVAGQSGAGKSSLLNALCPELRLEEGTLSEKIERGRHTTRHAELIALPHGALVLDTPGFSLLTMPELQPEDLRAYYPEFEPYEGKCRYRGCLHDQEPECAVKDAAAAGAIDAQRHARYCRMLAELREERRDYRG